MGWWQFWKRGKEAPVLKSFDEAPVFIIKEIIVAAGGFVCGQEGGKVEDQAGETRPGGIILGGSNANKYVMPPPPPTPDLITDGKANQGEDSLFSENLEDIFRALSSGDSPPTENLEEILRAFMASLIEKNSSDVSYSALSGSGNEEADYWFNLGNDQSGSDNFQGAITSYDKAIEIKSDFHEAWSNRGLALVSLRRYEEAIASFDKAIEINPDNHKAWVNLGGTLCYLSKYEDGIISYDRAIKIDPNCSEAWNSRGNALIELGRYAEAIMSCDKAIEIKPDDPVVCFNRGIALGNLGRYEEALTSYNQAIEIKPNFHEAWNNRGNALRDLERNIEALLSYNQTIEIKPDFHNAWLNRGVIAVNLGDNYRAVLGRPLIYSLQNPAIDQCGYSGEIANYRQGLEFCQQDTNPKGWGELHWYLGRAHYYQGKNQEAPFQLFGEARREYALALETLTEAAFPEKYLEVMQDYLKVYRALEPANLEEVGQIAYDCSELLQKLIKLNPSRKESLERKFVGFGQITVDLMLQSGEVVQALEQVEKGKAVCLDWMLPPREPLTWTEMQNQILDPAEALIYWYYSPLELHTILLLPQQAPQLIATTPVDALEKFLTTWNEQYSNSSKDKTKETVDETWRQQLPNHLINLAEILSIEKILPLLSKHNIQNLTLIPHRDLHRLPLHALGFPPQIKIRYLPTLHLKKDLEGSSGQQRRLLSVEAPDSISLDNNEKSLGNLSYAALESAYICQSVGEPLHRIANTAATKEAVYQALHQGCQIFHFSGHAGYNFQEPVKSALCLSQKDRLNIADILQISLDGCQLVCLSACETGITSKDGITTEYVGLVSAFLAQGVHTVVSTLWQVKSESSAIITIEFYRRLYHPENPQDKITALHETTHWLRTATVIDLIIWNEALQAEAPPRNVAKFLKAQIINWSKLEETDQPYSDPYHWAALTITGG